MRCVFVKTFAGNGTVERSRCKLRLAQSTLHGSSVGKMEKKSKIEQGDKIIQFSDLSLKQRSDGWGSTLVCVAPFAFGFKSCGEPSDWFMVQEEWTESRRPYQMSLSTTWMSPVIVRVSKSLSFSRDGLCWSGFKNLKRIIGNKIQNETSVLTWDNLGEDRFINLLW